VCSDEHLAVLLTRQHQLAVGQETRHKRGVDENFVLAFRQVGKPLVGQAEPSSGRVIGRAVRSHGRLLRERVQVLQQVGEGKLPSERDAVPQQVQGAVCPVDQDAAVGP